MLELAIPIWALVALAVLLLLLRLVRLWDDTWAYYLAIFHLRRVQVENGGALPPISRWWGMSQLLPHGVWLDWQLNQWLTVVFLDPPHSPFELVTGRLQRYINPEVPRLSVDASKWVRALWPARMFWWRVHRWWWELMPWRRSVADRLAKDKLDPYDLPNGHIQRKPWDSHD